MILINTLDIKSCNKVSSCRFLDNQKNRNQCPLIFFVMCKKILIPSPDTILTSVVIIEAMVKEYI